MPEVRDSDWVERECGREEWSAIERIVDEVTTRESDFGRVLSVVARAERYPDGPLAHAERRDHSLPEILRPVLETLSVDPANATTVVAGRSAP